MHVFFPQKLNLNLLDFDIWLLFLTVSAKATLCNTAVNDLSGTRRWLWRQCSNLMAKVTKLPNLDLHTRVARQSRCWLLFLTHLFQGKREWWRSRRHTWEQQSGVCDLALHPLHFVCPPPPPSPFKPCKRWTGSTLYIPGRRPIGEGGEGCAVIGSDCWRGLRCGLEDVGGLG